MTGTFNVGDHVTFELRSAITDRFLYKWVTTVEAVSRAGFVKLKGERGEKFTQTSLGTLHIYRPRRLGLSQFRYIVKKATEEEIATLPKSRGEAQKRQRERNANA